MKKVYLALAALVFAAGLAPVAFAHSGNAATQFEFTVLYAQGASQASARAAVAAAGGTVVRENLAVGVATVKTSNAAFLSAVRQQAALSGATRNISIGYAPSASSARTQQAQASLEKALDEAADRAAATSRAAALPSSAPNAEPLANRQWDMQQIGATVTGSYARQPGDKRVLVGIIDTGIDGTHPDIAPNFDAALSRNFTTDIPLIDGPCEDEADHSCDDPANVDENGHGTHVAGTIGAPINGLGIAGVAPNVTLVNLRAGQDSGYFFLQSTVDALTYAGDNGVDVVNMSFYTDPWLYNCPNNPADSSDAQMEQRTIIEATQRALDYARKHGVTLVAALGNEHTDLGFPTVDATSPDFPPNVAYGRTVDNSCLDVPAESKGVIGVSATGPSGRKAYYSNYGVEQTDVAAPGGDFRDFPGTDKYRTPENLVLAPYPESLAIANGDLNPDGTPNNDFVVRDCKGDTCAYYQYLQGTSMAAPHAVGVAALIVSQYGVPDSKHPGGLTWKPSSVEKRLKASAHEIACPTPRLYVYPDRAADFNAYCKGGDSFNGFYGKGIVDALKAVTYGDN